MIATSDLENILDGGDSQFLDCAVRIHARHVIGFDQLLRARQLPIGVVLCSHEGELQRLNSSLSDYGTTSRENLTKNISHDESILVPEFLNCAPHRLSIW